MTRIKISLFSHVANMDLPVTITETRRGKKRAIIENIKFREYRTLVNGEIHFRCCSKGCNVNAYVHPTRNIIVNLKGQHNHSSYSDQFVVREKLRATLKRKAEDELHRYQTEQNNTTRNIEPGTR
jgi:hypothetical protein